MYIKKLSEFIDIENERLKLYYNKDMDSEKLILAKTVKLTEEVGELSEEVLKHCSLQRKEKMEKHNPDNLGEEFADVIISTMLLANSMNVDLEVALQNKIKKINDRYEKNK
jgi:NTP pyrophosphatase (non-canonical NTP hydrolase)